jgi:hypothetical protein
MNCLLCQQELIEVSETELRTGVDTLCRWMCCPQGHFNSAIDDITNFSLQVGKYYLATSLSQFELYQISHEGTRAQHWDLVGWIPKFEIKSEAQCLNKIKTILVFL